MINLEDEYRRFDDFGMTVGFAVVASVIGCMLRYATDGNQSMLQLIRIAFYLVLSWNLASLRNCLRHEAPVAAYRNRTKKELVVGATAAISTTLFGGICFELI